MIVMKFGGTSLGDAERIVNVANIVRDHSLECQGIVVVASAMAGVTNGIIRAARLAAQGDASAAKKTVASLRERHRDTASILLDGATERREYEIYAEGRFEELERHYDSYAILGEMTVRSLDQVVGAGESLSVRLLAGCLRRQGVAAQPIDATELIVTDDHFGSARPLMPATRQKTRTRLLPLIGNDTIPVVTGYIGATEGGLPTTLGRGGGDYSAAILGACLDAAEVCIWTDVDGILTADPTLVPHARTLEALSYAEAAELAYFGADVLHPRTIGPVEERGIPLRIRNSFDPSRPGTLVGDKPGAGRRTVPAIISTKGLCLVAIEGNGDTWTPLISARALTRLAEVGADVLMFTQSFTERTLSLVVRQSDVDSCLRALRKEFEHELSAALLSGVNDRGQVATISVVGAPDRLGTSVVPQAFSALGKHGLQVRSVAQASSEYNVSFVVSESDMARTVRVLHRELGLDELSTEARLTTR
jgi:aspartokinase/homoserine dehydrogenase 1